MTHSHCHLLSSQEDVKDRLIKAGNIFYYRREAESFSNPVLETKSAKNTPTISIKKKCIQKMDTIKNVMKILKM